MIQLAIDFVILMLADLLASRFSVICSIVGALAMNFFIAVNHRPDRYIAI